MISALGRAKRLPLAPEESRNAAFYEKHGFLKTAEGQIGPLFLDVLEKYIGYGS